jgi:hypothetical protein
MSARDVQATLAPFVRRGVSLRYCEKVKDAARKQANGTPETEVQKLDAYAEALRQQGHFVKIIYDTREVAIAGIERALAEGERKYAMEQAKLPPHKRLPYQRIIVDYSLIQANELYGKFTI